MKEVKKGDRRPLSRTSTLSERVAFLETSLVGSEAKYRTLFESVGDAVFLLGEGGCIECNSA